MAALKVEPPDTASWPREEWPRPAWMRRPYNSVCASEGLDGLQCGICETVTSNSVHARNALLIAGPGMEASLIYTLVPRYHENTVSSSLLTCWRVYIREPRTYLPILSGGGKLRSASSSANNPTGS
jgi:hypothetical protein